MSSSQDKLRECIILAGGLGTRLQAVVSDRPKPMASVENKPFVEWPMDWLIDQGIGHMVLAVGYMSEVIIDYFGDEYQGCKLSYAIEHEPLGTGGAIQNAIELVSDKNVAVINGDSVFLVDLQAQFDQHKQSQADVTLGLKPMQKFDRFGVVQFDETTMRISAFEEKKYVDSGYINGGIYIFRSNVISELDLPTKFSIEKDFFEAYTGQLRFYGCVSDGYFLDIGTPGDYLKAHEEISTRLGPGTVS